VISHWEKVEKITITQRVNIVFPLTAYDDLSWNLAEIESSDIGKLYICSSDDWSTEGLCVPDFKVSTSIENYKKSDYSTGKYADIKAKQDIFAKDVNGLDTKLILVADNPTGPFTLIEGCKRSVALGSLGKLIGLRVYLGISPAIKTYFWSRHTYS
jgi:hypothetical protein